MHGESPRSEISKSNIKDILKTVGTWEGQINIDLRSWRLWFKEQGLTGFCDPAQRIVWSFVVWPKDLEV